ncbi:hypothetical protein FB451DRAFT_779082 [Mycena latifolia]|nr:hypothetical protein FB451DRAFT_779082 [Mycena latifolia]
MHRCLKIPEVLSLIFAHLAEGTGNVDLSHLAITCRTFADPALNLLWHTQTDLVPLLRCLELWFGADDPAVLPLTYFEAACAILPHEWDRFLFYSRRIKKLEFGAVSEECSLDVMELLSMANPVKYLLPNLQRLSWQLRDPALFPYIRLFLGPKIVSIDLCLDGPVSRLSILPILALKYPSLPRLRVTYADTFEADGDPGTHASSEMVCAMSALQHLSVPLINDEACQHLAMLGTLRSLTIGMIVGEAFPNDFIQAHPQPVFSSLRLFDITGDVIENGTNFVGVLSNPKLEKLRVATHIPATERKSRSLFLTISTHCDHTHLTSVTVHLGTLLTTRFDLTDTARFTTRAETIEPLLVFPNLAHVSLTSAIGFCLDGEFLQAMARAWPKIESLALSRSYPAPTADEVQHPATFSPPSYATILSLASFARHCPLLHFLQLPFDAQNMAQTRSPEPRPVQTVLTALHVLDSPLDDAMAAARFLSSIFPSLITIETSRNIFHGPNPVLNDGTAEFTWHKHWMTAARLVPEFATVRAEDEAYWREELAQAV